MKYSLIIFYLLLIFSFPGCIQQNKKAVTSFKSVDNESLSTIPENAIVLYNDWQMKESALIGMAGEKFSSPGFNADNWYPTTVPTTVLGVLVRNGIYPDPYIGMNNMKIPDASDDLNKRYDLSKFSHLTGGANPWAKPYWFRNEFNVPPDYKGKIVWLNLDGINYRADVWVNGRLVADSNKVVGMFRRFRFNITDFVNPGGKNALAISIHPLDFPGDPVYEQIEGLKGSLGPNGGDAEILRNVTQYSTIGWDWVPAVRDRNMGIWQHVSVNSSGPLVVSDPAAFTEVNFLKDTSASVTVRFFIKNASDKDLEANLDLIIQRDNLSGNKTEISTSVRVKANARQEVILRPEDYPRLILKDPDLWWPATYGTQPLYNMEIIAKTENEVSSKVKSKFGVRELESYILPSGGRAFKVNGKSIRITGGAWISDFLLSWSAQRYRDEVRLMAEGNATAVRVNGCSIMPPDVFFDECDKYGLMIWQDLSRTSVNPDTRKDGLKSRRPPACDSTIYMDNMIDCISRMRGHPSLLLWCGSNEDAPQENTGKVLQNEILPKLDGTRIFIPSSSEQPEWSNIDIHTYTGGPWNLVRLPVYYKMYESARGFESRNEIGFPSVQSINGVAAGIPDFNIPDKESFPLNKSMGYHDATGSAIIGSLIDIMSQDIGAPSSIAEFLKWGDLYNNQTYRSIFEAANKARPRNEGTMLWKSNAAWPSFNWQIFDWNLRANAGYYTMKSACKPIHVQFSQDDAGIQVVSTLNKELNVVVKATILSADGKKNISKKFTAVIPPDRTVYLDSVANIQNDSCLYFIAMDLYNQSGEKLDRTVTWTQRRSKWSELLKIPSVDIVCKLLSKQEYSQETEYSFEITNSSERPVINAMLEITDGIFGKEILPAFWDDNALTMMPGEARILKVRLRKNLITKTPFILIEGLNVNPVSWDITSGKEYHISLRINDINILNEDNKVYLNFSASQTEVNGNRVTTFPVKAFIDGVFYRNVSIAVKSDLNLSGRIELLGLHPGKHTFQLGDMKKDLVIY